MRPNPPNRLISGPRSDLRFDVDIGELSLHGINPAAAARVRADLERELAAQFSERGAELFGGGALARGGGLHLDQARIDLPAGTAPGAIGAAVARELATRLASRAHGGDLSLPTDFGTSAAKPSAGPRTASRG
jgi:hypothetical protein